MVRSGLLIALAIGVAAGPVAAQGQPDFSGTWKINVSKSDPMPQGRGGGQMDLSNLTVTIAQAADSITIETEMGQGMTRSASYYLDGRESTNPGMRNSEIKSKASWDGAKLVIKSTMSFGEMAVTSTEVRELSADGKTMTVTTTRESPRGTNTRHTVFEKQ